MADEVRLAGAALLAFATVLALVPPAMRLARATGCIDRPRGYRTHAAPTPYLGGLSLVGGVLAGAVVFGDAGRFWPILVCAAALCALGTLDDRQGVPPRYRVLAEVTAAGVLTAAGLGWTFLSSDFEAFLLNAVWIAGFTNAFNLMDNMDGAASTVGGVCAAGVAALATVQGDIALAALALAVWGACAGFLRHNLIPGGRARIFLGDGGSMPLGFLVAVATASIPFESDVAGWPALLGASLLIGIPVLDTLLVTVSRSRRGVSLLTGGRDHLTHRLLSRAGTPARVAATMAVLQAGTAALAIAALGIGRTTVIVTALGCLAAGAAIVALLERPVWLHEDERRLPEAPVPALEDAAR